MSSNRLHISTLLIATYHDVKSGIYFPPFYVKTNIEALRTFEQDVKRQSQTSISLYPHDFTLELLGEFADDGTITPYTKPVILATGAEFTAQNMENHNVQS